MEKENFDIIICGGGCSSMLLLYKLASDSTFKSLKVLIIEKEFQYQDKTWCFWHKGEHQLQHLITSSWQKISFKSENNHTEQEIEPYTYSSIKGKDFFNYFMNKFIPQFSNIRIINDEVIQIKKTSSSFSKVFCKNNFYYSNTVYSSIAEKQRIDTPIFLWQHFKGWHIKTTENIFDEKVMTIMDFSICLPKSFDFVYILPYSKNEALIEVTSFSTEIWDDDIYLQQLNRYICEKLNCTDYLINLTEYGRIPMAHEHYNTIGKGGEYLIGGAAGKIKSSSGYGFENMLIDAERLANNYYSNSFHKKKGAIRFKFYDKLLLKILQQKPEEGVAIFEKLFNNIPISMILKFLNEETNLLEEVFIFKNLPVFPFIKRIFN